MTDTSSDLTDDAPVDEAREAVLEELQEALGDKIVEHKLVSGRDLWIRVSRDHWQDVGRAVKAAGFTYFGFLSAIDWMDAPEGRYEDTEFDDPEDAAESSAGPAGEDVGPFAGSETRFQVLARVQKPYTDLGVFVKADLPDDDLAIDTWTGVYDGVNWHERELWEMFGIDVVGHPGLSHIYLPAEFEGHPLRKDFPLLARVVKPWPGVVDIEDIPEHLEERLEREVMEKFEAEGGEP